MCQAIKEFTNLRISSMTVEVSTDFKNKLSHLMTLKIQKDLKILKNW